MHRDCCGTGFLRRTLTSPTPSSPDVAVFAGGVLAARVPVGPPRHPLPSSGLCASLSLWLEGACTFRGPPPSSFLSSFAFSFTLAAFGVWRFQEAEAQEQTEVNSPVSARPSRRRQWRSRESALRPGGSSGEARAASACRVSQVKGT